MSLSAEATVHSFCIQCDYAATHLSSREYFCGQCFTVESLWKLTRPAETSQWKQTETLSIALLRSLSFATLCHLPSLVDIQTCQRLLKKKNCTTWWTGVMTQLWTSTPAVPQESEQLYVSLGAHHVTMGVNCGWSTVPPNPVHPSTGRSLDW